MTNRVALRVAHVLWALTIVLFLAGVVSFLFGPRLEMSFLSREWRQRGDLVVLRSDWTGRAIALFAATAICGVAGVGFSIKAARPER